ncbi:uncharacterized protein LOC126175213 [Schistocerca cancellata]|uniref:uncharacterized protein LOC126175213 n=1 Tax=Schistocerca cancellata TaxID=274614 RepID=UPI0021186529|nr:uncharacterized protein LOC126175213 [Schistocerca cancellata]
MKEINKLCHLYSHHNHRTWDQYLHIFQNILNELPNDSTYLQSILILKNKAPTSRISEIVPFPPTRKLRHSDVNLALQNIPSAAARREKSPKRTGRLKTLSVGQKVLIKSHRLSHKGKGLCRKFFLLYNGPYRVCKIIHDNTVEVETL